MFSIKNIILFSIAIALLLIGYILLGQGPVDNPLSLSIAPILLVATYCVLIPFAILYKDKDKKAEEKK